MKTMRLLPRTLASVALMLGACVIGRGQTDTTTNTTGGGDASFVSKNIKDNQKEIKMSQMAIDRSDNQKIKAIARQMIKDHTLMLEDLQKLQGTTSDNTEAMDNGATSRPGDTGTASNQLDMSGTKTSNSDTTDPTMQNDTSTNGAGMHADTSGTGMHGDSSSHDAAMMNATGKEFDNMWVSHMLEAHSAKLDELTSAQGSLANAQLKALVTKAIPKVRMHKESLQQLSKNSDNKMKGNRSGSNTRSAHKNHNNDSSSGNSSRTNDDPSK